MGHGGTTNSPSDAHSKEVVSFEDTEYMILYPDNLVLTGPDRNKLQTNSCSPGPDLLPAHRVDA
ncbi:uncharacterized protein N7500_005948 [Penicillium coprophilum]|uniref:uncharacterized protein n=1 Tax=Penicillium coprophilum TaxID=36646 RepID=UPI00238BA7C0|nr:uncharacterized protein N7500_005948 [Penicillium coprophilum]KAJ5164118.1 hypothetical protein N7500_005948 [Penicillium coprophilum]